MIKLKVNLESFIFHSNLVPLSFYWSIIHHSSLYLNSCSLTTSPRYSMMNCPAFRGSLVLIPQPFSSARNRSRHCTHSCLCILWLQHCSPQGQVLGEHSAKIILERKEINCMSINIIYALMNPFLFYRNF